MVNCMNHLSLFISMSEYGIKERVSLRFVTWKIHLRMGQIRKSEDIERVDPRYVINSLYFIWFSSNMIIVVELSFSILFKIL